MTLIDDLKAALGSSYSIERELGGGGMSRVFVGDELALGRKVAIKVLLPELAAGVSADRFNREIKLAAQLQHPNIVPVIATGVAAGLPYYTMPFVDGLSLRQRLDRNSGVPIVEAIAILKDVARALAYAHDHGIVHRDIKPENVLLADEAAVVTDFGIAKALSAARTDAPGGTLTQAGTSLGTPAYMAPEQISADPHVDHRADVYSFGCVAYELLTGAAPFAHRQSHQLYAAHITEKPASIKDRRADCNDDVAALIMKCLEKDPADRPQSARDLLRGLDASQTRSEPSAPGVQKTPMRRGRLAVISAIAGIAVFSGIAAYATRSKSDTDIHSLAVLPFANIGGDTANAYFAEGMSDELTTELARVPGLTLASRNSVARFKGADPKDVARSLNVGGVIDGTVRRAGNRLRLTAQLIDARSGNIMWTDSYESQAADVFAMQDSITASIVAVLKAKLNTKTADAGAASGPQGTRDVAAYDAYLQGRYLFERRSGFPRALAFFEQATAKDPKFARAYAGYAMAASVASTYSAIAPDSIIPLGIAAGRRAIELDPKLADGYLGLANCLIFELKWDEAEKHLKRAIELEPLNATAHEWYGDVLYVTGRAHDALPEIRRAAQIDPSSPVMQIDLGYAALLAGNLDEAEGALKKGFALDTSFIFARTNIMAVKLMRKQYDSVHAYARGATQPLASMQQLAAYRAVGDSANARIMRDSVVRLLRKPNADPTGTARIFYYAAVEKPDSAFIWMNRAIDVKSAFFFTQGGLPCDPRLRSLENDPRFGKALERLRIGRCR